MTSAPGYGPLPDDDQRAPVRPVLGGQAARHRDRVEPWRVLLVVLGCLVGPPVGAVTGFFGAVTYSGCFLSCEQAQPVLGALLVVVGLALLLAGPLLAGLLVRRAAAVGLAVLGSAGGLAVGAVLLGVL